MIHQTNDFYIVECIQERISRDKVKYLIGNPRGIKWHTQNIQGMTPKEKIQLMRELIARDNLVYPKDVHFYGIKLNPYKASQWVVDRRDY